MSLRLVHPFYDPFPSVFDTFERSPFASSLFGVPNRHFFQYPSLYFPTIPTTLALHTLVMDMDDDNGGNESEDALSSDSSSAEQIEASQQQQQQQQQQQKQQQTTKNSDQDSSNPTSDEKHGDQAVKYNISTNNSGAVTVPSSNSNSLFASFARIPPLDVVKRDKEYLLSLDIPGVTKDQVKVEVTENRDHTYTLHIKGERKEESEQNTGVDQNQGTKVFRSCRYGKFSRSVVLPRDVDENGIVAKHENGTLKLTLPRTKPVTTPIPKDIPID